MKRISTLAAALVAVAAMAATPVASAASSTSTGKPKTYMNPAGR